MWRLQIKLQSAADGGVESRIPLILFTQTHEENRRCDCSQHCTQSDPFNADNYQNSAEGIRIVLKLLKQLTVKNLQMLLHVRENRIQHKC